MANTVKLKRSSVASKVPTTSDLQLGELAVNTYDGKLYLKKDNGTESIVEIGGASGSGDVVGPASATDNAITRFDGTTGKLIQNSIVSLDDNGNLQNLNGIAFDTTPTSAPTATGSMYWDNGNGTPSVILDADVELQLGQENLVKVYNGTGSTISSGSVVAVSGAQGQRPSVVLADADSEPLSAATLGIATESIANGDEGFVTTFGLVRGLNTSAFTAGDPIYLSQTAGQFTATRPLAPAHTVFLGWVISVNASSGEVFVHISNGWEISELHDVRITSPTGGNLLSYDQTNGYWKNINLTDGTGISVTEDTGGAITVTNTAPDQVVSLTGAGTTSISGTYPSFTITSNDQYSGTVTSVSALTLGTTGTDLSSTVANGTTTPVITLNVPTASSSNRGALSSADWTTFNNKQAALVSGTNIKTVSGNSLLGSGDVGTIGVAYGGTGQTTYTNGQLLIGNTTGNTLTKATLTAGSGISITNGAGSITIAATAGSGDVTGPASSTDNGIARFNGTTGKIIQNSGIIISDNNNVGIGITPSDAAAIEIKAGTATVAPLEFTSGTLLTTPAAGAVEFNSGVFYNTPVASKRAILPSEYYYKLNSGYTGTNSNTVQSMFGVGITLDSSTDYEFEILLLMTKSAGTGAHTIFSTFGGTATLNSIAYTVLFPSAVLLGDFPSGATLPALNSNATLSTAELQFKVSSSSSKQSPYAFFKGTVSINAGGTFIPQYRLSAAPGGAYTTQIGSYVIIKPIGASGSNINVGGWA